MGSASDDSSALGEGPRTILVVDDERAIRSVTVTLLESLGYRALAVEDGASALATLAERRDVVDGVLLDLTMPEIGGAEVLDRLREVHPALPVVVMSGYGERETIRRLGGRRPNGFLEKPFSPRGLEESLRAAFELP
jgi:CheY-like chemotaxis protein